MVRKYNKKLTGHILDVMFRKAINDMSWKNRVI